MQIWSTNILFILSTKRFVNIALQNGSFWSVITMTEYLKNIVKIFLEG